MNRNKNTSSKREDKKSSSRKPFSKGKSSRSRENRSYDKTDRGSKTDVTTGAPFREFETTEKGGNDPAWYARNPQMLIDSGSYSFNNALGSRVEWELNFTPRTGYTAALEPSQAYSLPGILVMQYLNWPGESTGGDSAINIAARNVYSYVRHANSGHANYDAPDLMMYLLAMDSLYSFIAWCRRVYGCARVFSQKNWYYQKALTEAQNVNFADLVSHLSDFRTWINTISAKASAFAVPAVMPIMQRHFFLASNIYKDRDSEKSQLYVFQPIGFHRYGLYENIVEPYKDAGALQAKAFSGAMTVEQIIAYGEDLIAQLLLSEDIGIMSGDILKAYQGNIFTIPATPEEYTVMPVYDPEIAMQINNAVCMPEGARVWLTASSATTHQMANTSIMQNPNNGNIIADIYAPTGLDSMASASLDDALAALPPVISLNIDNPTPADVMVATRLTQCWSIEDRSTSGAWGAGSDTHFTLEAGGTELITLMYMYALKSDGSVKETTLTPTMRPAQTTTLWKSLVQATNFCNHPIIKVGTVTSTTSSITVTPLGYFGDADNYRVLKASDLRKLNQTALLSLYGVPALGTF